MNTRCVSIEAMRFIFMSMICIWHYQGASGVFGHGYLGVEFFFILSGVLLYRSASKESALEPLNYTLKKIRKFFPKYFIAIGLAFLVFDLLPMICNKRQIEILELTGWLSFVPECLMMQDIGIFANWKGYNYPLWYLSVLVYGGGWIYALIYFYRRLSINIVLPLIVVLGYTFLFNLDLENKIEHWEVATFVKIEMLRGVCDMSLGVLVGYLHERKSEYFIKNKTYVDVFSLLSFIIALILCVLTFDLDSYNLIFFSVVIVGCLQPKSLFNRLFRSPLWVYLGKLTFDMLLLHAPLIYVFHSFVARLPKHNEMVEVTGYIVVLIVGSCIFEYCFDTYAQRSASQKKISH